MSRGELVKRLRTRRGLTQAKLAKMVKMSLGAIQSLEYDMRRGKGMHPENAKRMLAELHAIEPLTDDELNEYAESFVLDRHEIHSVISPIKLSEHVEGMRPDVKALFLSAAGEVSEAIGEDGAIELFDKIARAVSIAGDLAVKRYQERALADLQQQKAKATTPIGGGGKPE